MKNILPTFVLVMIQSVSVTVCSKPKAYTCSCKLHSWGCGV